MYVCVIINHLNYIIMLYTWIKIHEKMGVMDTENRTPNIIKELVRQTTDSEHSKLQAQYNSKSGEYGMNNSSLDMCWHVPFNMIPDRLK